MALNCVQTGARPFRYFEHVGRFSAIAAAIKLSRSLVARLWDAHPAPCRQLPGVGKLLGEKLAGAGFGGLQAIAAADARVLERAVDKVYPWGDVKKGELAGLVPPKCAIEVTLSGARRTPASTAHTRMATQKAAVP